MVKVEERIYFKETSLQSGISSMIGIANVTYGCPMLTNLRPIVRFYLPFPSAEETTSCSASVYQLKNYLDSKDQPKFPKFDRQDLPDTFGEVGKVNIGPAEWIRDMSFGDASINSLFILDGFTKITGFALGDSVQGFRYFFEE